MTSTHSFGKAMGAITTLLLVLSCGSQAFALKYVVPYPNEKRDAITFVVHEKKNGSFEFRVIVDEKKLGQQVPGFLIMAVPKPEEDQAARGVEFSAALLRDREGKLHATFVLDKELAYIAYGELAVAPFPGDGKEAPGGTFYAFKFRDFVDFGPDAVSDVELQRRIEELSGTGRIQSSDASGSAKELLPEKVRPIRDEE